MLGCFLTCLLTYLYVWLCALTRFCLFVCLFVSDIRVSFNELVRLLGWVYRVYYPGKKRLSNEERKEVIEKLIEWYAFPRHTHKFKYFVFISLLIYSIIVA